MTEKNKDIKWYVINTYFGYEKNVKENLKKRIASLEMDNKIFKILVPTERVLEFSNGNKKEKELKKFPGYVLIKMIMDDDSWILIKNTPGVIGFIGTYGKTSKPSPLLDNEVEKMLSSFTEDKLNIVLEYSVGEMVKIINGKFSGNIGKVIEIDLERDIAKIEISLLGKQLLEIKISDIQSI